MRIVLQVTDTTTFTAEERRAEVDAWLYETCTQCLQHMVDIVALFYKPVAHILPRIFDLLSNFIRSGSCEHPPFQCTRLPQLMRSLAAAPGTQGGYMKTASSPIWHMRGGVCTFNFTALIRSCQMTAK